MECRVVRVHRRDAESARRTLQGAGVLRDDRRMRRDGDDVLIPVLAGDLPDVGAVEFAEMDGKTPPRTSYQELLPEHLLQAAPRAYDRLGDMVVVKVPAELWPQRATLGDALRVFHNARVVFHDHGVTGPFRVRELECIAGTGGSETVVSENGARIHVDPAKVYYSPRLATERARVVEQIQPGARVVDLFGGVAALGIQAAMKGAVVDTIDLNPEAIRLAEKNVAVAGLESVRCHVGDAREVATSLDAADHVIMNLPHGAFDFLDVAKQIISPGGTIHYHEIMDRTHLESRCDGLLEQFPGAKLQQRVVRTYSTLDDHFAIDIQLQE